MAFEIEPLVPELWCSDFERSLDFYTMVLGFRVAQRRGRDPHAYLSLGRAQIMLAHWKIDGSWEPWFPQALERPFGRGMNLQFMVESVQGVYDRVLAEGVKLFMDIYDAEVWKTDRMDTRRQFIILDPDGYLLRFAQVISARPVEDADRDRLDAYYDTGS